MPTVKSSPAEFSPVAPSAYGALLKKVMDKIKSERPDLSHMDRMRISLLEMKKAQKRTIIESVVD